MVVTAHSWRRESTIPLRISFLFWIAASLVRAQPSANYQVLWERDFARFSDLFFLQGAGVDGQDDVWVLTSAFTHTRDYTRKQTLFRIDGSGTQKSAVEIEAPIPRDVSTDLAEYYPTILSGGPAGFLINVTRILGRSSESRGAFYAPLSKSGAVGSPVRIFGIGGPIFWRMFPLTDGDILAVGDQSPLVIQKISPTGEVRWRRRFWKWLNSPHAAAMAEGGSCVVSSEYPRTSDTQELHLLRLDAHGALRQQTRFHGHLAVAAAGPSGSCAVFYYDYLARKMEDARYHLTVFDASFTQQWTKDIPSTIAGRSGMSWYLIALHDGYLAGGTAWSGDLFLAKYSWSGELRWIETRKLSCRLDFVMPSSDGFYLIGETESPQGQPTSFSVMRFTVLR
jgi:hypothetical protein